MKIIQDNIWNYHEQGWIVVTTNGSFNSKGEAVMGRGIALQAKTKYPELPRLLAERNHQVGNILHHFSEYKILTFPVKYKWFENADLHLIQRSWEQLKTVARITILPIFLTKPGCQNGNLKWEQVRPILEKGWTDQFTIVDIN